MKEVFSLALGRFIHCSWLKLIESHQESMSMNNNEEEEEIEEEEEKEEREDTESSVQHEVVEIVEVFLCEDQFNNSKRCPLTLQHLGSLQSSLLLQTELKLYAKQKQNMMQSTQRRELFQTFFFFFSLFFFFFLIILGLHGERHEQLLSYCELHCCT